MKLAIAICAAVVVALPAAAQVMSPAEYVKTAGASDLFERESSRLLLQSTHNPRLRSFAQEMIRDHGKSTAEVKAAAMRSKVHVAPPTLMPAQAKMMAQLRAERGRARDATYIAQQKTAHDQALTAQQAYATSGTAPALKTAAARIVPVVQHHIQMLNAM